MRTDGSMDADASPQCSTLRPICGDHGRSKAQCNAAGTRAKLRHPHAEGMPQAQDHPKPSRDLATMSCDRPLYQGQVDRKLCWRTRHLVRLAVYGVQCQWRPHQGSGGRGEDLAGARAASKSGLSFGRSHRDIGSQVLDRMLDDDTCASALDVIILVSEAVMLTHCLLGERLQEPSQEIQP